MENKIETEEVEVIDAVETTKRGRPSKSLLGRMTFVDVDEETLETIKKFPNALVAKVNVTDDKVDVSFTAVAGTFVATSDDKEVVAYFGKVRTGDVINLAEQVLEKSLNKPHIAGCKSVMMNY